MKKKFILAVILTASIFTIFAQPAESRFTPTNTTESMVTTTAEVSNDKSGTAENVVSNLSSAKTLCTQTINLNAGWNLISLDVSLADNEIRNVFSDMLLPYLNFVVLCDFDNGASCCDLSNIDGCVFGVRTLTEGFGYWVNVRNADVLTVEGPCITADFRKPLDAGWNLIAYPPDSPQSPETYFADLIADNNLEFVQGFDDGAVIFDPDEPAILNTLKQMENGRGYWVKVTNAVD